MYVAPEERGKVNPPTGVRFDLAGLRFAIWSPRGGIHGGISTADMPDPICAREGAYFYAPPVPWRFRQEWGTDHFEVEVAVSGMDVSFDPAQVTVTKEGGQSYNANSSPDKRRPDQAWILRYDIPCVPEGVYDLVLDGVTKSGARVPIPPIHFAPASTSSFSGP
jgi:hypothetical protein